MIGYDQPELRQLERLYGIVIAGDLERFLLKAGRSDGGIIGDDPVVLYRPTWNVRTHVLFQMKFFVSLQDAGAWEHLEKPFVIALESETQYYFLKTGSSNPTQIHRFDENEGSVADTQMSLGGYLLDVMRRYGLAGAACVGEMLRI